MFLEVREKVRKTERVRTAINIREDVNIRKRIAIINKGALLDLSEELKTQMGEATDYQTYRKAKYSLNANYRTTLDAVEALRDRDRHKSVHDTISELATGRSSRHNITPAKAGTGFTEIHIVDPDEVIGRTQKLIIEQAETVKMAKGTGERVVPGFTLFHSEGSHQMSGSMLNDLDDILAGKNFRRASTEGLSYMVREHAQSASGPRIQREYKRIIHLFDTVAGTNFGSRVSTKFPVHTGVLKWQDSRRIAGQQHVRYPKSVDAQFKDERIQQERLVGYLNDESVDARGKVIPGRRQMAVNEAAFIQAGDSIYEANRADRKVTNEFIRKNLEAIDPVRLRARSTYNYNNRVYATERMPKRITKRTGLLGMVTSIFGAYFYQSMLHQMARRAGNIYDRFIQPGEIIEAKKHSSTETAVRRMMSTDFGARWGGGYAITLLKDWFSGGRTASQQVHKLFAEYGQLARRLLDPKVRHRYDKMRKYMSAASPVGGKSSKAFGREFKQTITEGIEWLTHHGKAVTIATGSAILLTRLGPDQIEKADDDFLRKRYARGSMREHLQHNQAFREEAYQSANINKQIMTGYGSPFDNRNWFIKDMVPRYGRRQYIHTTRRDRAGTLTGKILKTSGFQFSRSPVRRDGFLKYREISNRIPT